MSKSLRIALASTVGAVALLAGGLFLGLFDDVLRRLDLQIAGHPAASSSDSASSDVVASASVPPAAAVTDPAVQDRVIPVFDLVRVEPSGDAVIAGQGAPDSKVEILSNDQVVASGKAGPNGEWAIVLSDPLKPGAHDLNIRLTAPSGEVLLSSQSVAVSVPEGGQGEVLVVLNQPGTPSTVLQVPGLEEAQKKVAAAGGDPAALADEQPAAAAAPTAAETAQPAETAVAQADLSAAQPAPAASTPPATAPAPEAAAPAAETPAAPVPELPAAPAAPAVETPKADLPAAATPEEKPAAPDADPAAASAVTPAVPAVTPSAPAVPADAATRDVTPAPAPTSPEPAAVEPAPAAPAETPAAAPSAPAPAAPTAPAETPAPAVTAPATTAPAAAAPAETPAPAAETAAPAVEHQVAVDAVELENGKDFYAAGSADAGATVRIYVDDSVVGDAKAENRGRWLYEGELPLKPGKHNVRVDLLDRSGKVVARSEVPFDIAEDVPPGPTDASGTGIGQAGTGLTGEAPTAQPKTIIIRRGDNLWMISRRLYGAGVRYSTIYQANTDQIRDPDLIYPGQVFVLPQGDAAWKPLGQ